MDFSRGRQYRAIPGPSVVPESVLRAMHRASPNIYEGEIIGMTETIVGDLRRIARTESDVAMYICNGHGAWETALANMVGAGDRVLVCGIDHFALGWGEVAKRLKAQVEFLDFGKRTPVDPARVEERLRQDKTGQIKAVLVTHVDTATSIRNDVAAVRQAMDRAGHAALLAADCIASLACDRMEMDEWGVDVLVAASQKGLMLPPGLGFVLFNAKAGAVRSRLSDVSAYWDWVPRAKPKQFYEYFAGTAPTHHLFGLRASLDMLHAEGIEAVWARHEHLAHAIWAACDAWSQNGPLQLNVKDAVNRSRAVTSLRIGAPNGFQLRQWLEENTEVTLGIGLGMADPGDQSALGYFRIGHMGHINAHMVLGLLGAVQAGLEFLGIPHGPGGLDAAIRVISQPGCCSLPIPVKARQQPGNVKHS